MTKNNLENQAEISSLKNMGKVNHDDVTVDREDGKFHFKRIQLDKKESKIEKEPVMEKERIWKEYALKKPDEWVPKVAVRAPAQIEANFCHF